MKLKKLKRRFNFIKKNEQKTFYSPKRAFPKAIKSPRTFKIGA